MAGVLKTRFEYGDDITAVAGAAVTAARALKWSALGAGGQGKPTVIHTTAGTEMVYGFARRDAASGDDVTVTRRHTVMLLEAGAAIAAGAEVMASTGGKVITRTGAGTYVIGIALHAAAADGSFVWCLTFVPGIFRPA